MTENTRHAKWGKYTAIVIESGTGWYANIFYQKPGDEIDSTLKSGQSEQELATVLQQFDAPIALHWTPGSPKG